MKIEVAKTAGFCFGVDNAVRQANEIASSITENPKVKYYMLGELIHNKGVVQDILNKGLTLVHSVDEIEEGSTVLIRTHGISPVIEEELKRKKCVIVNCTCPFVVKIHDIVRNAYSQDKQILLVGDKNHPEMMGINGECDNSATIIETMEDIDLVENGSKPAIVVAQTTFSYNKYEKICENLKKKIANLEIFDTICITTENRQKETEELASRSDMMIVIGSKESSNTKKLFDICSNRCRETYLVEYPEELDAIIRQNKIQAYRVGITAGASTPETNIREVINTMSENVVQGNQQEQDKLYFSEYVESISQLHRGATVRGAVIRYDNEFVYVDVHDKSEGRIPVHEFSVDPDFDLAKAAADHTEVDVYVRSIRNTEQGKEIILSKAKVDFGKYKDLAETAFNDKQPVMVKVVNVVKDGVIANYSGVDIYIHRTQLEAGNVEDLESYKGKSFEILITQFDPDKKRLRVSGSRRVLLNQARKEKADLIWAELEVNKVYTGTVRSLTDFGAFVDIGGVDGLVHISELSWNRIRHPSEVVKPGESIEVYIKDFDIEKHRISLGYKKMDQDPYHDVESKFPAGTIVRGKVVRMFPFGVFVEIAPGIDALCHISQISNMRLVKPSDALTEGMEVSAKVLEVSNESRRISISIKEVEPIDPIKKKDKEIIAEELPKKEKPVPEKELVEPVSDETAVDPEESAVEEPIAAAPVEEKANAPEKAANADPEESAVEEPVAATPEEVSMEESAEAVSEVKAEVPEATLEEPKE